MAEEIELTDEQEEALDRAWAKLDKTPAKASRLYESVTVVELDILGRIAPDQLAVRESEQARGQPDNAGQFAAKAGRASQVAAHHSKKVGGTASLGAARDAERHSGKAAETGDPKHHEAAASAHHEAAGKHISEFINGGGEGHLAASKAHGEAAVAHAATAGAIRRESRAV